MYKSVLWRVAERLSYVQDAWCLKVKCVHWLVYRSSECEVCFLIVILIFICVDFCYLYLYCVHLCYLLIYLFMQ